MTAGTATHPMMWGMPSRAGGEESWQAESQNKALPQTYGLPPIPEAMNHEGEKRANPSPFPPRPVKDQPPLGMKQAGGTEAKPLWAGKSHVQFGQQTCLLAVQ